MPIENSEEEGEDLEDDADRDYQAIDVNVCLSRS